MVTVPQPESPRGRAEPEDAFLAEELAAMTGDRPAAERRALSRLFLALFVCQREGSTCLPLQPEILGRALHRIEAQPDELRTVHELLDRIGSAADVGLESVLSNDARVRPLLLSEVGLQTHRLAELEARVAGELIGRLGAKPVDTPVEVRSALDDIGQRPCIVDSDRPIELSREQLEAVRRAAISRFSCVTGGPGTGKTSIVVSILRVLKRSAPFDPERPVVLAAPTGKAADRLRTSVRRALEAIRNPSPEDEELQRNPPEGRTLHRLLGVSSDGRRCHHDEANRLPPSFLIVDEASMIDLVTFDRLLRALDPDTRVVLLGDADQLPSVDPGAVFRDLVEWSGARSDLPVCRLTHSYRQRLAGAAGVAILTVADAVRSGGDGSSIFRRPPRERPDELELVGYERLTGPTKGLPEDFLDWWWRRAGRPLELETSLSRSYTGHGASWAPEDADHLEIVFHRLERDRLLAPTRKGPRGTLALNQWFHRRLAPNRLPESLAPGQPVLMTRNLTRRGLFNGDLGWILWVRRNPQESPRPTVVFPLGREFVAFDLPELRSFLEPAWALTVHKAQGSEFDHVGIVLPADSVRSADRTLLYTAITRARRSVVIVGGQDVLLDAVREHIPRHTGLRRRLSETQRPPARTAPPESTPPKSGAQLRLF